MKVAAVVVWFNPNKNMISNTQSYSGHVLKTFIIDNSTGNNLELVINRANIEYIPLGKNIGIAAALNIGFARAEELGMEWVLTMDQDSSFLETEIRRYLDPNADHFKQLGVAVFGPNFNGSVMTDLVDCNSVISSGSLVSLAAYKIISGYNEDLFIDQVDHEYCCRLKKLSYRILWVGYISMAHTVGSPIRKKRFGRVFISHNHNAIRKYYITRNMLYMRNHFRGTDDKTFKLILMDIANVIFIESDKLNKIKSILKGVLDYFLGKMGPMDSC